MGHNGMRYSLAIRTTAWTSSVLVGLTTADGRFVAEPGTWKGSWKSSRDAASLATLSSPIAAANATSAFSRSNSVTPGGSGRTDVSGVILILNISFDAVWRA